MIFFTNRNLYITLLGTILIYGCGAVKEQTKQEPEKFKNDEYRVDYGGCSNRIQMELTKVGYHLYIDDNSTLYFLTYDRSDETGKNIYPVFIQGFRNNCFEYIDVDTVVDFSQFDIGNFIDVESFTSEEGDVYKDKYRYYRHVPMAGGGHISMGEPHSFKTLEKSFYKGSDGKLYIKTQSLISPPEEYGPDFYREVPAIDIASFELLCNEGWYAKDKDSVYIVHGMTDGKHIWVVIEADAKSFECISYRWGKDNNHVFENGKVLQGLNPDSLIVIDADYSEYGGGYFEIVKDNDQVFYNQMEITGVDVESFKCIRTDSSVMYQDRNWLYNEDYFPNLDKKNRTKR